ncbi:hypothetical protein ABIB40_000157 [Pedobacter sp. UYP30]|uniref:hypothetical protein n=1 Tax=Pedobacter sp. UYP30 TaxID=1756400 RepID=UPI0033959A7D
MNSRQSKLLVLIASVFVAACQNGETDKKSKKTESGKEISQASIIGCYQDIVKRDTFQLTITAVNGDKVEGTLFYNFYEKDDSKGSFEGVYNNGILNINFSANGEGTTSVREGSFKKVSSGFVEGTGEIKMDGNKQYFSDPKNINYDGSLKFVKSENCLPSI